MDEAAPLDMVVGRTGADRRALVLIRPSGPVARVFQILGLSHLLDDRAD